MACCADCQNKTLTLGKLGWLPVGFDSPPTSQALPNPVPDPTLVRAISVGGLLVHGLIAAGGVGLWRGHHKIWGGLLLAIGGTGIVSNLVGVASGKTLAGG